MTDRFTAGQRSPVDKSTRLLFKNVSGESMPAFAVFRITQHTSGYYEAVKPDGEYGFYFINGPVAVANNSYGDAPLWTDVAMVQTDGTFASIVGPEKGSWLMKTSGMGWMVFGNPSSGVAAVVRRHDDDFVYCKLSTNLNGATQCTWNKNTKPTGTARVWVEDGAGGLKDSGKDITVVNRLGIAFITGTVGVAKRMATEFLFSGDCDILPDCESSGFSGSGSVGGGGSGSLPSTSESIGPPPP